MKVQTLHKRTIALAAAVLLVAVGLSLVLRPHRSIAEYCRVYHQENQKLEQAQGNTYSAAVFTHHSDNPKDFQTAFSNLDAVAPSSIEPDIRTLKNLFQTINSDPAKGFTASLGAVGADLSVKNWTQNHCK